MPLVVCFIGWHNSGKTTLARQVVTLLKERGHTVGVIKSTKETGISPDPPGTDTELYHQAGAVSVSLAAPDQLLTRRVPLPLPLTALAARLCPDVEIVIGEGFKQDPLAMKIEVRREADLPLLRDQVPGVMAVVTDLPLEDGLIFRFHEAPAALATLIEGLLPTVPIEQEVTLRINGAPLPLPAPLASQLATLVRALLTPHFPDLLPGSMTLAIHDQDTSTSANPASTSS